VSVPLSGAAAEVLRALVLGLDLREGPSGWTFIGPWQDPPRSGVRGAVMAELFGGGFLRRDGDGSLVITPEGESRFSQLTKEALSVGLNSSLVVGYD
jgi:hypothetical protein